MPGANYMGGKRSAARARIKDADGKVQRSHFGKKRFEVLRTGLSKSSAPRDIRREPPEITLAHARRRAQNQNEVNDEHEWERNWVGLRSPSTSPVLLLRSPPVKTVSRRSKILTMLDADDPAVRRAQVQKILQTPDLLGLSNTRGPVSRHETAKGTSRTLGEPVGMQRSSFARHVSLKSPILEDSPSFEDPSHFQQTHSSRSTSRERTIISSPKCSSCQFSRGAESTFIPMFLDSSPPPYADDSGYTELWPHPYHGSEGTRVPFYPQYADANQRYSIASSVSGRAVSSPSPEASSGSSGAETLLQFAKLSRAPSRGLSYASASPSHLELPSPLMNAQFLSDLVSPMSTPEAIKPPQLYLLNSSRVCCSELASQSVFSSPDISQADFSPSPPCPAGSSGAEEGVYTSTKSSNYSSQIGHVDNAPEDIIWPTAEEDSIEWDYVCLKDILGELFEDADPWDALSKLLGLPSSPVGSSGVTVTEDLLAMLGTSDRRGVGYTVPGSPSSSTSFPTSQARADVYRDVYPPSDSSGVVSSGPPLSLGRGCRDPCTGHQARGSGVEAKFAESPLMKTILPYRTCPSPRCSEDRRSSSRQTSVTSLADRHESAIQVHQTAKFPKAPGNGEDFTNEDLHVGDRGSQYIALHSERDDNMELVDGPSLFDDDALWCYEE